MKKLLVVAYGLSMAGSAYAALSLDTAQALGEAVLKFPANLIKISNIGTCGGTKTAEGVCSTGNNFEDNYNSMQQSLKTLAAYKKGATVTIKGKSITLNNKNAARLKLIALKGILESSSMFIELTHKFITIVKDDMIMPVLKILGKQSAADPVVKIDTVALGYKTKLDDTAKQISDIVDLITLLSEPEAE